MMGWGWPTLQTLETYLHQLDFRGLEPLNDPFAVPIILLARELDAVLHQREALGHELVEGLDASRHIG